MFVLLLCTILEWRCRVPDIRNDRACRKEIVSPYGNKTEPRRNNLNVIFVYRFQLIGEWHQHQHSAGVGGWEGRPKSGAQITDLSSKGDSSVRLKPRAFCVSRMRSVGVMFPSLVQSYNKTLCLNREHRARHPIEIVHIGNDSVSSQLQHLKGGKFRIECCSRVIFAQSRSGNSVLYLPFSNLQFVPSRGISRNSFIIRD